MKFHRGKFFKYLLLLAVLPRNIHDPIRTYENVYLVISVLKALIFSKTRRKIKEDMNLERSNLEK